MAPPNPLGRFFKPVAAPANSSSPQTTTPLPAPAATAAVNGSSFSPSPTAQAPSQLNDSQASIKRLPSASTLDEGNTKRLRATETEADEAPSSLVQTGTTVPLTQFQPLTDLKATLHQAGRAGGLPPFTAECFHHFASATHYSWPTWLQPDQFKDARGVRPGAPGFDQGTVAIPSEKVQKDEGHGTPMLLQFWKVKSAHFDKIALFKVGKFYEVFYYDAFIAQHVCGLKWMSNEKKPHVGFPEMAKHDYAKKLVDAGYKVIVVEQVERVQENKQRAEEKKQTSGGPAQTCIQREPCEVFTKGTVVDAEMMGGANARFMAYLHFEETNSVGGGARGDTSFAACLVDCATSQISVGRVADGPDRNALRTILAQAQPSEIVYSSANLPSEVLGMLRRLPCKPQLSTLKEQKLTDMAARERLEKYRRDHPGKMPPAIEKVLESYRGSAAIAAAGALEYLADVLLSTRVLPFAIWEELSLPSAAGRTDSSTVVVATERGRCSTRRMVLDSTALAALEILETLDGTYKGSLLEFLDNTSTPFGFRLLKQWICAPLFDVVEIRSRSEAIEFFIANPDVAQKMRDGLRSVDVDLERATSRVWGYALQAERHAVMYEDVTAKRLRDFAQLLAAYEKSSNLVTSLSSSGRPLPDRLALITKLRSAGGSFPDLKEMIDRLRNSVVSTSGKNDSDKYRPRDGADPAYDSLSKELAGIKGGLDMELQGMKQKLPGVAMTFNQKVLGFRYEIEADDSAVSEAFLRQHRCDLTSRLKGKVRFQTERIKQLVTQLEATECKLEDCIWPFLSKLFQEFYAHQAQFRAASRLVSEVDALLSLSVASQGLSGHSCCPEIVEPTSADQVGTLELRNCQHPVAAAKMGAAFVPNDTLLQACEVPSVLVVTGPNMGGKSTVLRQTCIAVVMAQIGCRVNAAACRLTPVDRIFTRIGSYDTILEGKSTLLTELEETASVLAHGTRRSLAVLDELGRGTSTFDGAAIAAAVLDEIARTVGCLALFATHYHPVSRDAVRCQNIAPFHMAANLDEQTQEMTFLYRFLPGLCPASHGHNVAKLAGLPQRVLEEAKAKSDEFEKGDGTERGSAAPKACLSAADQDCLARISKSGDQEALRAFFRRCQTAAVVAANAA
eukprot:TRINITY_DN74640_c0_g1_i1.p1 TRINITY_DN74640_c0_g1~~TRINITY_DN74640_c0_g1_i1.p1  ORF type:complete len:1129 (-),score=184.22 TRINITY_DN74640_c0_g1_i1:476-3862(-)